MERILGGKGVKELEESEKKLELGMVELGSQAKSFMAEAEEMEKYLGGLDGKENCPVCGAELGKDKAAHLHKEKAEIAKRKKGEAAELRKKLAEMEKELLHTKKVLREAAGAEGKARLE
ncbi:MAG: hypothetical protein NTY83_03465, partial [Candidatus Micrarchaeota archaeon]|nr:hypothetical protein [Candidatus Micrarchaeota archaeon]